MTYEDFGERLQELRTDLFNAKMYYGVWLALWPTEEAVGMLNRWRGFFAPVRLALYGLTILQSAKMFDRDHRTISFPNLLKDASQNPTLIPHAAEGELDELMGRMPSIEHSLDQLKALRDQRIAHHDATPKQASILKGEMDSFLENTVTMFNDLSRIHARSGTSFDYQEKRSVWETGQILEILREEANRGVQEVEDAMQLVEEEQQGPK